MIDSIELVIWDRNFSLPIEYNCYEGEVITTEQNDALMNFISHKDWIENAKRVVEVYCKEDVITDEGNLKKDNIFSYVKPECIFVKHEENPRIALMCKYRYDLEHGLAVVFSSDGKITVGQQDIIL